MITNLHHIEKWPELAQKANWPFSKLAKQCWILGGLLFFCFVFAHQKKYDGPSPISRLDLLHAIFVHNTVCIDAYHTNTPDKSVFLGHYYSDKAPGTVAVALPVFAVSDIILKWLNIPMDSGNGWFISSWITCAGSLAFITALGGVALYAWLCHWVQSQTALITVLALFLGAAPLPYSTMMFSHGMVVGLISIAIWSMRLGEESRTEKSAQTLDQRGEQFEKAPPSSMFSGVGMPMPSGLKQIPSEHNKEPKSKRSRDILAGFCCGLAIASEYSSGLIVVGLFVWLLATNRHRAFAFAVAALAPLMLIPLYSWACFGSPFVLAYSYQASFPEMQWGIYAIQWPDPVTAWNLLIPPTRGLFFWTPFLLMAGLGYYFIAVKRHGLFLLTYMVPLLHVVVISGRTWDWQAGFAFGPRLLAPMLPLLALPCALGARQWPKLGLRRR